MKTFTLIRSEQNPDGTFGTLIGDGITFATMEDDWLDNRRGVSCIPAGTYRLQRSIFYKHGYEAFEVTGVPGRSRILIHIANTEEDVEGCIGLGLRRGKVPVVKDEDTGEAHVTKEAVLASKEAFARFMAYMADDDEAMLTIRWAEGLPQAA